MAKNVISVRLSETALRELDDAAARLSVSRSVAIAFAIRLLPTVISDHSELKYDLNALKRRISTYDKVRNDV